MNDLKNILNGDACHESAATGEPFRFGRYKALTCATLYQEKGATRKTLHYIINGYFGVTGVIGRHYEPGSPCAFYVEGKCYGGVC